MIIIHSGSIILRHFTNTQLINTHAAIDQYNQHWSIHGGSIHVALPLINSISIRNTQQINTQFYTCRHWSIHTAAFIDCQHSHRSDYSI